MATERNGGRLFEPIHLGSVELSNRIVMAPMTRNRAGEGNVPTAMVVEYYRQRASAGLIVTEASQIMPEGQGYPLTPGIHSAAQIEGWRRVTEAVHAEGGKIALQLWHVGRISHPTLQPGGKLPVAPSAIAAGGEIFTGQRKEQFVVPRALEREEIGAIVREFGRAAERALDAGFDLVELHGANGYLIDQFLRDGTNRRTDEYGGSVGNRVRFLTEVTESVVRAVGGDRVGVRLSPLSPFNDMRDSDPVTTFTAAVAALSSFGLAYLHVIEPVDPSGRGEAQAGERLTPRLKATFGGPIMANGSYDRASAEHVLETGEADLVSFGKPFLANPDLPARLRLEAELNQPDPTTFYGGDARGYIDYPALAAA